MDWHQSVRRDRLSVFNDLLRRHGNAGGTLKAKLRQQKLCTDSRKRLIAKLRAIADKINLLRKRFAFFQKLRNGQCAVITKTCELTVLRTEQRIIHLPAACVHHSTDDTRQLPCVLRHSAQRGNARARDVPRHGKSLHAGDADAHPRERTRPGGDRHAGHIVKRFIRELQNRFHHRHQRLAVRLLCVDIKFREYFSVLQKRGRGRRRRGIEC